MVLTNLKARMCIGACLVQQEFETIYESNLVQV